MPAESRRTPRAASFAKNDLRGGIAVARDWLMIILAVVIAIEFPHPVIIGAAVFLIGSQQYALAEVLLHEAAHYNLFRTRRYNNLVEPVICWLFFRSIAGYRRWHLPHHRFFNTPADPLYAVYQLLARDFSAHKAFQIWWIYPFCGVASARLIRDEIKEGRRSDILRSLALYSGIAVVAWQINAFGWLLLLWFLPLLIVFPAFYHWQEIEDHFACVGEGRVTVGRFRAFLHHNSGYHQVHHAAPTVPFYHLPSVFKAFDMPEEDISTGLFCTYRQIRSWALARRLAPDLEPLGKVRLSPTKPDAGNQHAQ